MPRIDTVAKRELTQLGRPDGQVYYRCRCGCACGTIPADQMAVMLRRFSQWDLHAGHRVELWDLRERGAWRLH